MLFKLSHFYVDFAYYATSLDFSPFDAARGAFSSLICGPQGHISSQCSPCIVLSLRPLHYTIHKDTRFTSHTKIFLCFSFCHTFTHNHFQIHSLTHTHSLSLTLTPHTHTHTHTHICLTYTHLSSSLFLFHTHRHTHTHTHTHSLYIFLSLRQNWKTINWNVSFQLLIFFSLSIKYSLFIRKKSFARIFFLEILSPNQQIIGNYERQR